MRARAFPAVAVLAFLPMLRAGPVEDAIVAAMRLSDRASYSWVATVDDDARTYNITGRTSQAGYTRVRMPVVNAVRRRLGRGPTDNIAEVIFRGNVRCVLATDDGWKTVDELPPPGDIDFGPGSDATELRGAILSGPAGAESGRSQTIGLTGGGPEKDARGYSNIQMGLSHPHEELGVIVSSGKELRMEGDALTGTLSELGAQLLLVRDGQTEITPLRGAGTFTLWFRDGMVSRYQVRLEGVLAVQTRLGAREVTVHQLTTTVIKDIDTTEVEVPFEAEAKLADQGSSAP